MTVQRCKISDESIRHALPMGEHIHIFSASLVIYLRVQCSVLPVSTFAPKRVMDVQWGFMFFGRGLLGGCVIRGCGKEMDCFADFSHLHCFYSEKSARHLPSTFWIAHKSEEGGTWPSIISLCLKNHRHLTEAIKNVSLGVWPTVGTNGQRSNHQHSLSRWTAQCGHWRCWYHTFPWLCRLIGLIHISMGAACILLQAVTCPGAANIWSNWLQSVHTQSVLNGGRRWNVSWWPAEREGPRYPWSPGMAFCFFSDEFHLIWIHLAYSVSTWLPFLSPTNTQHCGHKNTYSKFMLL